MGTKVYINSPGHTTKMAVRSIYGKMFLLLNQKSDFYELATHFYIFVGTHFQILFVVTATGVVPCGGPKNPLHHPLCNLYFTFDPMRSVQIL